MSYKQFPQLALINHLLHAKAYDDLEQVTLHEWENDLLSPALLDAARMMRLPATVIYLASLAVENLADHAHHARWLAVYQSLGRGAETEGFASLPGRSALQVVASHLLHRRTLEPADLRKCRADTDDWIGAVELAVDQKRFDLLETIVSELIRRKIDVKPWLLIIQTLFRRQEFLSMNDPVEKLATCYVRIRQSLVSTLYEVIQIRSSLALYACRTYHLCGDHRAVIRHAQNATTPLDRLAACINIARAHCHLGEFPQSVAKLDEVIGLLAAKKATLTRIDDQDPTAKPKFDADEASKALLDLQAALAPLGHKPFLVSGTLLGYAREGKLLAHDKDIDVGIIGWEGQFDIIDTLLKTGLFGVDFTHVNGRHAYHLAVKHNPSGVNIDIFIYHPEDGMLVTGVESYFGYLQKFAFSPFAIKSAQFLGIDFYVPDDVEKKLAENFGDWRKSDPGYISHLESPATVDVGGPVYQIVGRLRALEALRDRNNDKLERVIRLMDTQKSKPLGMSDDTLQQLQSLLQEQSAEAIAC